MVRANGKKILKAVGMITALVPHPNQRTTKGAKVNIGRHCTKTHKGCNRPQVEGKRNIVEENRMANSNAKKNPPKIPWAVYEAC